MVEGLRSRLGRGRSRRGRVRVKIVMFVKKNKRKFRDKKQFFQLLEEMLKTTD